MGGIVCFCSMVNVACSHTAAVRPYMNSAMTEPLTVPEGLSTPQTSHEMDVPEEILMRVQQGSDADIPRSEGGEALPPGLSP